jgi:hypothetical protein
MVYHVYNGLLLSCCPYLSRLKPSFQVTTFYFYHLWNYDRFKCLKYMTLSVIVSSWKLIYVLDGTIDLLHKLSNA